VVGGSEGTYWWLCLSRAAAGSATGSSLLTTLLAPGHMGWGGIH
jgi:hypothetical protein